MPDRDFQFRAPNRRRIWRELALTMSQAAQLTGVSERQIQHWMSRGYIAPLEDGKRKINGESLDAIILIGQARTAGIPLRRAADMAHEFLRGEELGGVSGDVAPTILHDVKEHVTTARQSIDAVLRQLGDLEGHPVGEA